MAQFYNKPYTNREGASVPDSRKKMQGSVTAEAALTLPLFLFAILSLIYILEIQAIRLTVSSAAQGAAKAAAEDMAVLPVFNPIKMKSDLVQIIGSERLERSIVEGGSSGIHCWRSWYESDSGVIHVELDYKVRLPFPKFTNMGMKCRDSFLVKAWNGYKNSELDSDSGKIVYVTETGGVYHTNYQCNYLKLSIRFVPYSGMSDLRNEAGGKYHACEQCVHGGASAGVYITDYGNKYHNSLNCSSLKRTVYSVKKGECQGMSACSKCGQ
ncbi:pilus assembly protein [Mediterraneibacter agrestimuris]|uniref:pilus assembly protein n=1 Tax=Mediterraneibacter agrestimuris TaxID=2941333 RepID=UPI00203C622A|nr:pilus assembly protein [Mediterraneibacter agrestimuris]